jgi:MYXO-CTERM domain-containing protein
MRPVTLAGLALLAVGALILFRGLSYTADRSVIKVGEFKASVEERQSVPAWVGGLAVAAGLVLVVAGRRRRE